ncbi:MAG: type II secretion system F family protein [Nanoarchaeota archaeon]|nr:type II secretion system F family protein [Nanoarchaeota archaeon]
MNNLKKARTIFEEQKGVINEINSTFDSARKVKDSEKKILEKHLDDLRKKLKKSALDFKEEISGFYVAKKISSSASENILYQEDESQKLNRAVNLEKFTLKRLKESEEKETPVKETKPSKYVTFSNQFFGKISKDFAKEDFFRGFDRDLIRANMQFTTDTYISMILLTTTISFIFSAFLFAYLMFFETSMTWPIIQLYLGEYLARFTQTFWVMIFFPLATLTFMYFYPSLEKRNAESKIDQELPFATINMAAISGSLIDPTKIFSIIISTKEYPALEKEFRKILNEINFYGYNLASALRRVAFNTSSRKLSDLLNGLSTTITSGGDMPGFFDKRAQSLLFEYQIEKEKYNRSAETFMDIYISVVIAAPMILMLLLMIISVSGLGFSLSSGTISLLMILSVSVLNFLFLLFLNLKQPRG